MDTAMNVCPLTGEPVKGDGRRGTPSKWDGGLWSPTSVSRLSCRGGLAGLCFVEREDLKPPPCDLVKSHLPSSGGWHSVLFLA